tara:strand:- start:169 stop:759 length:591 start_codon:yes stop_codon:yes gene_type:complete
MNLVKAGNDYGGYYIDLDSVKTNDTILDLGVGKDYSFSEFINLHKDVKVVAVDPTAKALKYNESKKLDYITFINKAVYTSNDENIVLYKNNNPNHVSDSIDPDMKSVGLETYTVKTISLKGLIERHKPSLIKLDIEGAEYNVYQDCLGVKQVCLETHDYKTNRTNERDIVLVNFFKNNGYNVIYSNNKNIYSFLLQ